jgi:hypothetical protein
MIWKKIQDFKVRHLLLSYCGASQHVRKTWADDIEFFQGCGKGESFGEVITRFSFWLDDEAGSNCNWRDSDLIPTKAMMRHFDLQGEMVFLCNCVVSFQNYACEHLGCCQCSGIRT